MTHVINSACIDVKDRACVDVCPVDCIHGTEEDPQLYIHPEDCIDCTLCIAECPVKAIWPEDDLPEEYTDWTAKNAELYEAGTNVTEVTGPLDGASTLDQIHEQEKAKGWDIPDPA